MKLAILGLGGIGRALAARAVDRGHQVTGWNRTPRTFDVPTVPTPGEAVAGVDLALIVVADDRAVSELCTTELLAALPPQALLLVVSTVAPSTVRDIDLPGRVLDTPVLGAPELIAAGSGQFLVGGDEAAAQRAGELLDDLGAGHTYCGPLGAGAVMKIVSNLQLVIGVAAMSEAIAIARGNGLPDDLLRTVLADSGVVSATTRGRLSNVLDPAHPGWFTPSLAAKDVRLALALAADAGVNPALGPAAVELLARVEKDDWDDLAAVIEGL